MARQVVRVRTLLEVQCHELQRIDPVFLAGPRTGRIRRRAGGLEVAQLYQLEQGTVVGIRAVVEQHRRDVQ